ncbi:hypothetical protein JZ751_009821 [Albula glossodonta]|uniref:Myotubularin phosphatase domain-containing protein n=1 Tax=Albula glossodonta TaxID=121402 RepID=A0A8T2NY60_9TELE|nr:hypothetical protein JZ751_009821 [Albula glossodonta]
MLSHSGLHTRGRDMFGLRCLPGECVLQRAVLVRKKLSAREGGSWLAGTLFCTHFRVAFVPQDSQKPDDNADPVLLGDHDVALASIEKVVAVGPSRTKLVTPNSSLKFTPEELVLYCRDLRVVCFLFDRLTPETQAVEITYSIAKTYQPLKPGTILSFQNAALGSVEMKQFLSNRRRDAQMNWFESAADWERDLERTGATGWRVSAVNDRFEMATSLPKFNVVPQKRWCWRHPRGSDLLRMASFQNNIYHEKDDIRNLEALLFGGQQQCVVVELAEDMPTPADIQLAHTRLRALCLGGTSRRLRVYTARFIKRLMGKAVASQFPSSADDKWLSTLEASRWLDHARCCLKKAAEVSCLLRGGHMTVILQEPEDRDMNCLVSSLVQVMCDPYCRTLVGFQGLVQKEWVMAGHRFLSRANYHRDSDKEEFTGDFLLALHDSVHLPLFSTFLSNCQRERSRRSQRLSQSYTPVNGWREVLPRDPSQDPVDPPLPPVWDWSLQYSCNRRARFTHPVAQPAAPQPVLNGNLNTHADSHKFSDGVPGSVFLLSRGTFSSPSHLLPWRNGGGSGSYRKSHRRAPSSESLPGLERMIKTWSISESPRAPSGPQDPHEPLLPLLLGPCVGVWRDCYLRGALQAQVPTAALITNDMAFCHPTPTSMYHPVDQLAWEVQQLKDKLALASTGHMAASTKKQEPRRPDANLNQNTNNGTFLFSAPRPSQATPRGPPPTSALPRAPPPAAAPPRLTGRDSSKRTFLFGHPADARPDQRYAPMPNTRLPKNNGPSLGS